MIVNYKTSKLSLGVELGQKRVFQDSFSSHALLRLFDQQLFYEIHCIFGQTMWKFNVSRVHIHYLFHGLLPTNVIKGRFSYQQLICENSHTPHIHTHVILATLQDLRCSIVKSATVCSSSLVANRCPAKITQLTDTISKNYVFWFDISVSNAVVMQVFDSLSNLLYFDSSLNFLKFTFLFEVIKECPFLHVFQQKIKMFIIVEDCIDFNNIFVVTETLDSDLQCQLLDHKMGFDSFLTNFLQSEDEATLFVQNLQHSPKLTFSQSFHNDKI